MTTLRAASRNQDPQANSIIRMNALDQFGERLASRQGSTTVYNPYELIGPSSNLGHYLRCLLEANCGVLAIGEAPGYLGCKLTGIPFTSESVLRQARHPSLRKIASFSRIEGNCSERSASRIWRVLEEFNSFPVLWNAFPFHPHSAGNCESNRTPNSSELQEGLAFLSQLVDLFKPKRIVAMGGPAFKTASRLKRGITLVQIPHPANREKNGPAIFADGLRMVLAESQRTQ